MAMDALSAAPLYKRRLDRVAFLFLAAAAGTAYPRAAPPLDDLFDSTTPAELASDVSQRRLSAAISDGGCEVFRARPSESPIPPTWQASYPGSGARMTWVLIEALTGIVTNNDYNSHGRGYGYENVVAVKTHYPAWNGRGFPKLDPLFGRAIVILRNPLHAIPSLYNYAYEKLHHLSNHSTRGSQEEWLKYRAHRTHGVKRQLKLYRDFVEYWMEKYDERRKLLLVTFEALTDELTGPTEAMAIADFLGETEGVDPIAAESIPCVWETIVNYKYHRDGDLDPSSKRKLILAGKTHFPESLRSGPEVRPYTKAMLDDMTDVLQGLMVKYDHDKDLVAILSSYVEEVLRTPIEEGL